MSPKEMVKIFQELCYAIHSFQCSFSGACLVFLGCRCDLKIIKLNKNLFAVDLKVG